MKAIQRLVFVAAAAAFAAGTLSCPAGGSDWMKRWLCGDAAALARTTAEYRALNKGFDIKTSDCGPVGPEGLSCGGGGVLSLPGTSLVGRQATELQEVALDVKRRFGTAPDIFTRGRMAVAAAHAVAVNRGLFGRVESIAPPPSWTESVEKSLDTPMSICVNGALLSYDWMELVPVLKQ